MEGVAKVAVASVVVAAGSEVARAVMVAVAATWAMAEALEAVYQDRRAPLRD